MPAIINKAQIAKELLESLDDNDVHGFSRNLENACKIEANLDELYGAESGHKTILHLALEEDDGQPYVAELLRAGASADFYNPKLGCAPIHVAAISGMPIMVEMLLTDTTNRADINRPNRDGLTAFHILLTKLIDLAALENKAMELRGPKPMSDDELEFNLAELMDCLHMLAAQRDLNLDFDNGVSGLKNHKNNITIKKVANMTPLQILCSFQTWNAKVISDNLHKKLENLVAALLSRGIDPNSTGAKNALPGEVSGSTPGVLLAANRGYYRVVEVFKMYFNTNFLVENKFKQTILHILLKAGYYNKIVVHGDESGQIYYRTVEALMSDNNLVIQQEMRSIINRQDSYGNTALHYAKQYPDQSMAKFLLRNGAKIDVNPQKVVNVNPRTLEEYFYESCFTTEGDDLDEEEFCIKINFQLFEKPIYGAKDDLSVAKDKANAWSLQMEETVNNNTNMKNNVPRVKNIPSSGKVDTRRLEYFSDVDSLHPLLKHPLITSFLELELNSLKYRYLIDFGVYLIFVIILFVHLSNRYGILKLEIYGGGGHLFSHSALGKVTIYVLLLFCYIIILFMREVWQIYKQKKRYFLSPENYIEWFVLALVIVSILPTQVFQTLGGEDLRRHLAALTLLIAFMQLYLLLVRVVPNTPIPIYINMFTTVLKTYTFILLSYLAFILSFAYSFFLMFGGHDVSKNNAKAANMTGNVPNSDDSGETGDPYFGNIGLALVKTLVMFVGEMDYTDLNFTHWLGYIIFVLFVFLLVIVLMNILNGLAVSDIHKIQEEVDTYYHISIVETLASTSFVSLLAEEVIIRPNTKPEHPKILCVPIPGLKVYKAKGGKVGDDPKNMRDLSFSENTVKAAKELVALKKQQSQTLGAKVTLENLGENMQDLKWEQNQLKLKLNHIEDNIKTILEIMSSRHPAVERL